MNEEVNRWKKGRGKKMRTVTWDRIILDKLQRKLLLLYKGTIVYRFDIEKDIAQELFPVAEYDDSLVHEGKICTWEDDVDKVSYNNITLSNCNEILFWFNDVVTQGICIHFWLIPFTEGVEFEYDGPRELMAPLIVVEETDNEVIVMEPSDQSHSKYDQQQLNYDDLIVADYWLYVLLDNNVIEKFPLGLRLDAWRKNKQLDMKKYGNIDDWT